MGKVVGVVLVDDVVELVELDDEVMLPLLEPDPEGAADPDEEGALVAVVRKQKSK